MNGKTEWLASYIAFMVTTLWAVSFVADLVSKTYDPPAGIYPLMTLVIGGTIGLRLARKDNSE